MEIKSNSVESNEEDPTINGESDIHCDSSASNTKDSDEDGEPRIPLKSTEAEFKEIGHSFSSTPTSEPEAAALVNDERKDGISNECACGSAEEFREDIALECNAETLPYSHTVKLIELPDLVTEEILKHLSTSDKLSLRLTCRTTKQWVETPKFLSLFQISVPSSDDMINLIKYSKAFPLTKWRQVSFPEKMFTSFDSFPSFVSIFSCHITRLHLRYFNGGLAEILFLSSCETLEHLKLDEMNLRQNPELVVASDKSLKSKCPKLLEIFSRLKSLLIGIIFFNEVKQLSFYQTFLQRCRKLEKLNVPRPQGPPTISWENLKNIQLKWLIGPIGEYLRKKPVTSPMKTDIEVLDVDGLFSKHFPVMAETIVQIVAPTLFENVNEKHVKYLFIHGGDVLHRIVSLKEKIDDRRPISKWSKLQRLYVRSSRCDIRNEYTDCVTYPSLKCLTIVMDSRSKDDPNFLMLGRLVKLLISTERGNLRDFTLQWPLFSHDTPLDYIRGQDFVGNFCNLTKLRVSGWDAPDDDFILIFNVLGKLKVLVLEECRNLTDHGLLCPSDLNEPAIMNLKGLIRLEIRNRCNRGSLTDDCFAHAFMHMRLHHFVIESFHVTMRGYECLAEGEFKSTITRLPVPHILPRGILTEDEFFAFASTHFPTVIL